MVIRVAQILQRMDNGGIESVIMNYYRNIDHNLIQFDFFVDENSSLPQKEEIEKLGGRIFYLPKYSNIIKYIKTLYKLFKNNNYMIVHSHLSTMNVFSLFAAYKSNIPIRISHNHSTAHWKESKKTLLKYILRPFNKIFATHKFACGKKAGIWMYGKKDFLNNKVYLMENLIDTKKFVFNDQERKHIRSGLDIKEDTFVVGHIGRFSPAKNHEFLIEIFTEILNINPNSKLVLIGEGELEDQIKQKVDYFKIMDKVLFLGTKQDVNRYYSIFDVFCLPSIYEGLPVVFYESLANGLNFICSTEVSDEINEYENVIMLDLKDKVENWAKECIQSRRYKLDTIENIDIKEHSKKLEDIYLSLIGGK